MAEMSLIQALLDAEAAICNSMCDLGRTRALLQAQIADLRGEQKPICFGNDDCSTQCLSTCAWRNDCGN